MSKKPDKRLMTIRNSVIGGVVLIAAVIVGYGLFRSTAIDVSGEFDEGKQYKVIPSGAPVPLSGPIRVTEFFSYGCVHCRNFDPEVNDWLDDAPKDVLFERSPVTFSPTWALLARSYYALANTNALEQNHERIFKAIHDNRKQFPTLESVADFVNGNGVTRDDFLRACNSPATGRSMAEASRRERALRVVSVPTLTVADHYEINLEAVPRKKAFEVVDFLVAKIRADRAARAATTAG